MNHERLGNGAVELKNLYNARVEMRDAVNKLRVGFRNAYKKESYRAVACLL